MSMIESNPQNVDEYTTGKHCIISTSSIRDRLMFTLSGGTLDAGSYFYTRILKYHDHQCDSHPYITNIPKVNYGQSIFNYNAEP
jgi:hypothetical protein